MGSCPVVISWAPRLRSPRSRVVPRHVLGGAGNTPPSEKVNVAAIGAGGMGAGNTNACADAGANIVALCDVDWDRAAGQFKKYPERQAVQETSARCSTSRRTSTP